MSQEKDFVITEGLNFFGEVNFKKAWHNDCGEYRYSIELNNKYDKNIVDITKEVFDEVIKVFDSENNARSIRFETKEK